PLRKIVTAPITSRCHRDECPNFARHRFQRLVGRDQHKQRHVATRGRPQAVAETDRFGNVPALFTDHRRVAVWERSVHRTVLNPETFRTRLFLAIGQRARLASVSPGRWSVFGPDSRGWSLCSGRGAGDAMALSGRVVTEAKIASARVR